MCTPGKKCKGYNWKNSVNIGENHRRCNMLGCIMCSFEGRKGSKLKNRGRYLQLYWWNQCYCWWNLFNQLNWWSWINQLNWWRYFSQLNWFSWWYWWYCFSWWYCFRQLNQLNCFIQLNWLCQLNYLCRLLHSRHFHKHKPYCSNIRLQDIFHFLKI